jgi:hypothetical protein
MAHFSFTRGSYDKCALEKRDQESTGTFKYATDVSILEPQQGCFIAAGPFQHNPYKSVPASSVDIESDLRGQSWNLSRCPSSKYNPQNSLPIANNISECKGKELVPEYTRIGKPCNVLSGITINRFHPLCDDLQDINKIPSNSVIGFNTRLGVKDAFAKKQS